MSCIRTVALIVNCGYARVSIYENSNPSKTGCHKRSSIDTQNRALNFRAQFSMCPNYGIPENYFEHSRKDGTSQFDHDCNKILDGFASKFRTDIDMDRDSYLKRFSLGNWSELPTVEKHRHTLSNCNRCYECYKEHQHYFPLKPIYKSKPLVQIDAHALQRQGVKRFTTNVLSELNTVYIGETSKSFTDALVATKSAGLEKKKSKSEKRKAKREVQRSVMKKVNECFAEKAAITLLTEGESKRKYHRKRLAQSFCSPHEQPPAKKKKTHSPSFENVPWDTEQLENTLRCWPADTPINWSAIAREHGIPGANAGQVAKEFAETRGINIALIQSSTPNRKTTVRPTKKRLPGTDIAIPSNPPLSSIDRELKSMVASGRFTLGEECAPYSITRFRIVNGQLTPHNVTVHARKVPLKEIRERLLHKHSQYMRLTPTHVLNTMTTEELTERLKPLHYTTCSTMTREQLSQLLVCCERTRSLALWHDHATILKMGYIMLTIHVMYDPLVFYTDVEYYRKNPHNPTVSVQSQVEQPEIYLLSAGSSTVEDQSALIGDRLDCLSDLSDPVETKDGIQITDRLRFFTGDHPATQFEQGTKQGGTYKCGACGCKESMFDDQAHSLTFQWRSLEQLQSIATAGINGKMVLSLKPFDNLKVEEIRRELIARGMNDVHQKKPFLLAILENILRGVMRVPALLLTHPTQNLSEIYLDKYEVVASEPLHDIKGHIINIITELPHILSEGNTATKCTHLITNCLSKEKKSGADLRRAIIQIYLLLKDLECSTKILLLLQTIIKVGEISYSKEDKRSPRQLLQLYNNCWMHMELCRDLFPTLKTISRSKMFGHYLHALTAHSPTQYELACLRSLNTENQERIFGQARRIAETCTNHHPENIIPQLMLRLQAKQEQAALLPSIEKADTQVSAIAHNLPQFPGMRIKKSFVEKRADSWQLHLQRISPFLVAGPGVWWESTEDSFHFFDGDQDAPSQSHHPPLFHFRHHSIKDVERRQENSWKKVVQDCTIIPAYSIKIYNSDGIAIAKIIYKDTTAQYVPFEIPTTSSSMQESSLEEHSLYNRDPSSDRQLTLSSEVLTTSRQLTLLSETSDPHISGQVTLAQETSDQHTPRQLALSSETSILTLSSETLNPTMSRQQLTLPSETSDQHSGTCMSVAPDPSISKQVIDSHETPNRKAPRQLILPADKELTLLSDTSDPSTVRGDNILTGIEGNERALSPESVTLTCICNLDTTRLTGFKTSLASSISKVLKDEDDDIAKEFDTLRYNLKEIKRTKVRCPQLKEKVSKHNSLAAKLSAQILAKKSSTEASIKDLEHKHFQQHGRLPSKRNNQDYSRLLSERNLIKAILRNLNVRF